MAVTPQGIQARVRILAENVVSRSGYELVDVEYRREPRGWTLRLYIDKEGGVNLDDCQRLSQEFGTILEVEDPIPGRFNLEVSSPGLDRPLRRPADFTAVVGRKIRLGARESISGQRNFVGRLVEAGPSAQSAHDAGTGAPPAPEETFTLRIRDEAGLEQVVPLSAVERARLVHEWPAERSISKGRRSGRNR